MLSCTAFKISAFHFHKIYGFAFCSCRVKRIEQRDVLDTDKVLEQTDIENMVRVTQELKDEVEDLQAKYDALREFALQKKIEIPYGF